MEVVDNASDENNENTRRKATVVPIKIEYEKNTKGEMIANETHNEEAVLLLAFAGNGRGRKSD